ncbi:ATP-binding protein [Phormidium sp. CCY1219]|uniref:ATP-binding protein n=1 Tax=Phormidium sp. CCY1219 TaxID=2886104 RepID=UPI002D1E8DC7|nr:ATP-binding protein [Phormidium sp. CCY1219]MEB3828100.1 GAF domain-containing protein [Phormidium sp. CCY1219]
MAESFTVPLSSPVLQPESPARLMQEIQTADVGRQLSHLLQTDSDTALKLQGMAQMVGELFQVDCCFLAAIDRSQEIEQTSYWYAEPPSALFSSDALSALEGVDWLEKLADADLLMISDTRACQLDLAMGFAWERLPVRGILGITTRFSGQVNGAIILMHRHGAVHRDRQSLSQEVASPEPRGRTQPNCWTAKDMMKLTAVSEQVAIALNQITQTQLISALQQQVRHKTQYQTSIHQLTMAIHRGSDINLILQMAIGTLTNTLEVDRSAILLLKYIDPFFKTRFPATSSRTTPGRDSDSHSSTSLEASLPRLPKAKVTVACENNRTCAIRSSAAQTSSANQSSRHQSDRSFWLSDCYWCQQAFVNAPTPLAIADQRSVLALNPEVEVASIFHPEEMPALLVMPLLGVSGGGSSQGTVLGFIVLQHSSPRSWQPDEIQLVELVAAQLSTAILQTQTLQQVQALVEERTSQLQRSLEVQAKLYEKTRQQIDQLRQLNQLKDEFLTTLSHELNTPLTSMKMAIQMLRQPGIAPDRQAKYLEILETEWKRESNLVQDLLKLQQYESQQANVKVETLELKQLLPQLADSFSAKWEEVGLTLALDLPQRSPKGLAKQFLKLNTDPESFDRILHELLTNAGKYSDPGTTVYLQVNHHIDLERNEVTLRLTNIGAGISPEDLPHIFEKFRRGQGVTEKAIGGTGLGLALVKCLVQHLNGTITVSSYPLENSPAWETCFTLTLPQLVEATPPS